MFLAAPWLQLQGSTQFVLFLFGSVVNFGATTTEIPDFANNLYGSSYVVCIKILTDAMIAFFA